MSKDYDLWFLVWTKKSRKVTDEVHVVEKKM